MPVLQELRANRHRLMSEAVVDNFRKFTKSFLYSLEKPNRSVSKHKALYQVSMEVLGLLDEVFFRSLCFEVAVALCSF